MRLTKEERYQIKLIRLANDISSNGDFSPHYEYCPHYETIEHEFFVFSIASRKIVAKGHGFPSAEDCYKWALAECKKKGVIR